MPWTKEGKIFCLTTYLETNSFKAVQPKFRRKFNFKNYPQKRQIYRWVLKFQATGSVNNLNKKEEIPNLAGSWLQDVLTMWIQWEILWEGDQKVLPKKFPKTWSFMCTVVNQFLPLSSGLTFLKWYDCFLRLRWKMTWCNMNYHINGLHLFWDTL